MAFALKASPYLSSSSAAASSSSSPALLPLPGKHASARVSFRPRVALAAPLPMRQAAAAPPAEKCNVSQTFSRLRKQGKTAFIPYITAGDPDLATTAAALKLLDACGADVIELGLPYSDPIADGPVIQGSASRALTKGVTLDTTLAMLKEVVPQLSCPVVLFTYYNPIMRRSVANFTVAAKEAGVHENAGVLRNESIRNKLELVQLTTPVTPIGRMEQITQAAQGFVYLVSVVGVTGARSNVNPRVQHLLQEIKQVTDKAVAVGFGISTPEHVKQVAQWGADGVIIGSAMVRQLGEASSPQEGLRRLEVYAKSLKAALS